MEAKEKAQSIVNKMYAHDAFSQWLGIEVIEVTPGYAKVQLTVREEMTNGFFIAHGGITYSLADSAFAFASNGYGEQCVSIETSISHQAPVRAGDTLVAEAKEIKKSNRIGWYDVLITNQDHNVVASFKGTVYRTKKIWTDL